jgi:hypothetical protein
MNTLTYFQETTPLQAYCNWWWSGPVACVHRKQSWNPTPDDYGLAVRTAHRRIFCHLLYPLENNDQKNLSHTALFHPSGNGECCDHLLDGHESKPPVEANLVRNQFNTPVGDENLEYKVS